MVLNDLEVLLCNDEELCRETLRIIDISVEVEDFVKRLESIKTNIPVLENKILILKNKCLSNLSEVRENLYARILGVLEEKDIKYISEKLSRIQKTIYTYVENYPLYKQSRYYARYSNGEDEYENVVD